MWWAAAVNYLTQPPKGGTVYQTPAAKAGIGVGTAVLIAGGFVAFAYLMQKGR